MIEWQSTLRIKSDFYTDTLSLIEKFEKWKLENTCKKRRDLTKKDVKEYRGKTKEPNSYFVILVFIAANTSCISFESL